MAVNYISQGGTVISVFLSYYQQVNGVSLTAEQLYSKILKYDSSKFLQILGSAYVQGLDGDFDRMDSAMSNLASKTKGGYPDTDSFFAAMNDQNSTFHLVTDIASSVGSEVYDGAVAFGETSLNILKGLNFLLPVVIFGGIGFFIYKNKDLLDLKNIKKLKP